MKISVKICTGTACYIMGGATLLTLADHLTEEEKEKVVIEGTPCMGLCKEYNPNTPYAQVNDEIIPSASVEALLERIRSIMNESGN